jgi:hypothetical protein
MVVVRKTLSFYESLYVSTCSRASSAPAPAPAQYVSIRYVRNYSMYMDNPWNDEC